MTLFIMLFVIWCYFLGSILAQRRNVLEKLSLGFLVGNGLFTFVLFLIGAQGSLLGYVEVVTTILILSIISLLISLFTYSSKKERQHRITSDVLKIDLKETSKLEIALISILFLIVASVVLVNFYWPVRHWDALTLYDSRAKLILVTGNIESILVNSYFLTHPLLTSMSHFWAYVVGFKNPMFIYSLYYVSFVFCFYYLLKRNSGKLMALVIVLFVSTISSIYSHASIAYANLPYMIYVTLGFLYLYEWLSKKKIGNFFISALLIGISTWTRSVDPFWICSLLLVLMISLYFKKAYLAFIYTGIVYAFKYPWTIFRSSSQSSFIDMESKSAMYLNYVINALDYSSIKSVAVYVWKNSIANVFLFIVSFILTVFLLGRNNIVRNVYVLILICVSYGLLFFGSYVYYTTGTYSSWLQLGDSIGRMSMFFRPLLLFFIGVNIFEYFYKK